MANLFVLAYLKYEYRGLPVWRGTEWQHNSGAPAWSYPSLPRYEHYKCKITCQSMVGRKKRQTRGKSQQSPNFSDNSLSENKDGHEADQAKHEDMEANIS